MDRTSNLKSDYLAAISIIAGAIATAATGVGGLLYLRGLDKRSSNADDPRDVFAFIVGLHGFHEEAERTRSSYGDLSYWSESDRLTEAVLRDPNEDRIRRAMKALESLLDYAFIEVPSQSLIHFDIARLAMAVRDEVVSHQHLAAALHSQTKVVQKRVIMDEALAALARKSGLLQ